MTTPAPIIEIKAKGNQHALFLILLAATLFFTNLILSQFYWQNYRLPLIFCYLTTLVVFFVGILKRFEPRISFQLTPIGIKHNHRHGYWTLTWLQIQQINTIKVLKGFETVILPYVGIRLKNIDELAHLISPRLANRLIHEQRPLLYVALTQQLVSLDEVQMNFDAFPLASGEEITGPIAAFLHQSIMLRKAFGYHLYIVESTTDRDIDSFCQLLKQCQQYSIKYM